MKGNLYKSCFGPPGVEVALGSICFGIVPLIPYPGHFELFNILLEIL